VSATLVASTATWCTAAAAAAATTTGCDPSCLKLIVFTILTHEHRTAINFTVVQSLDRSHCTVAMVEFHYTAASRPAVVPHHHIGMDDVANALKVIL
jgi:hypothetical protein